MIQFFFAPSPLPLLLFGIIILLLVFLGIEISNLYTFASLSTFQKTEPLASPLLSILVPARNEEESIEACVRSLLAQDYASVEVLVLDDQSSDGTASILHKLQAELSEEQQGRLRLLKGSALPSGWVGKNYACYQLAQAARGDYFVFTDADTMHAPTMARSVLNCMHYYSVQFLSAQPLYLQRSLGERLVIPLINFAVFTLLPVALIYHRPEPSLAMGNGQFLCFKRSGYEKIGGHASVKGQILEDVLLARTCKAAGLRIIFVDALEQVRCRMYHSFNEVWRGFSKNLFALHNYSLPFALCTAFLNLLLYVFPVILLCLTPFVIFSGPILLLAWSAYILAILLRILLALRFTQQERLLALLFCWLHPLSMTLQTLILLNSIRWRYRKAGTEWKGRYY